MSRPAAMTFDDWLLGLEAELINHYGYSATEARRYVKDQPKCWRDFYDDEYSPTEAAADDFRAGL